MTGVLARRGDLDTDVQKGDNKDHRVKMTLMSRERTQKEPTLATP